MTSIAVFNNKGGVGKTSLVYHLAWMYANLDYDVVVADLDPQANLTSMFLEDEELEELWTEDRTEGTIYSALRPLLEGTGDVKKTCGRAAGDGSRPGPRRHAAVRRGGRAGEQLAGLPRREAASVSRTFSDLASAADGRRGRRVRPHFCWMSAPTSAHSTGRRWWPPITW